MNFSVGTSMIDGNAAVVAVEGEADLYTAPQLKDALNHVMDEGRTGVLVDLSKSTFIDSTTLGVLMGAIDRLRRSGGGLAISCHDPNIRRIFEITLLDQVFPIFDTREDGEAHVRELAQSAPA